MARWDDFKYFRLNNSTNLKEKLVRGPGGFDFKKKLEDQNLVGLSLLGRRAENIKIRFEQKH